MSTAPDLLQRDTCLTRSAVLRRRLIYAVLLFFTAAAAFDGYYSKSTFLDENKVRSFAQIVEGTAYRPYVYRQLVPTVANWADRVTPASVKNKLNMVKGDSTTGIYPALFRSPVARNPVYSYRYLVFYFEVLFAAVAAIFLLYMVCRAYGFTPHIAALSSSVMVLMLPYLQIRGGGFFSDFPELAFFALAVLVAKRFHWLWLLPIAFLGTYDKESFLLLLISLWPILRARYGNIRATIQVGLTGLVGVPTYLYVKYHFRNNPGSTTEIHFAEQVAYFAHPKIWLLKFGILYGTFVPEMLTLIPVVLTVWLVRRGWKDLPSEIRLHALLGTVMIVPLFIVLSVPGETRDLCIWYIVWTLLLATNLRQAEVLAPGGSEVPLTTVEREKVLGRAMSPVE